MKRYMIREINDDVVIRVTPDFIQMLAEISSHPLDIHKGRHRLNTELSSTAIRGFSAAIEIVDEYKRGNRHADK